MVEIIRIHDIWKHVPELYKDIKTLTDKENIYAIDSNKDPTPEFVINDAGHLWGKPANRLLETDRMLALPKKILNPKWTLNVGILKLHFLNETLHKKILNVGMDIPSNAKVLDSFAHENFWKDFIELKPENSYIFCLADIEEKNE